jgi:outer membrane protein assembly factor BamD (BamD/ComL family)
VWSLINAWNKFVIIIIGIGFLILFILISGCAHGTGGKAYDQPYYREHSLFRHAGSLLEQGDFTQARQLYVQFLEKYPKHPYADDAAYRLAYMHVMIAENNPYFDYSKARTVFQNFIESYQNSHYISACKNWINVLDFNKQQMQMNSDTPVQPDMIKNAQISEELRRLRAENASLRQNLEQLQRAIER